MTKTKADYLSLNSPIIWLGLLAVLATAYCVGMNMAALFRGLLVWLGLSIACLYGWGGICYLVFRHAGTESEARMRVFLRSHYRTFALPENPPAITKQEIKRAGSRGWVVLWITGLGLMKIGAVEVLLSVIMLFFGGLMFAYSWYGLRCLRVLKVETWSRLD